MINLDHARLSRVEPEIQPSGASKSQPLMIRPMKLEDVPRVHEIDVLSFALPWPEKSFLFELNENPTTLAVVAELKSPYAESGVVGMAVVWIVVDEAHIATIAIHPDYRGNGYGKKLLAESLRRAIRRGVTQATLEVRDHNLLAQSMYQKFGFIVVGRRPHYYMDNGDDAVIMTVNHLGGQYIDWLDKLRA
jgi:ribosomal-protein-alanine N-acetyltransferase